jgi:hypothetical protein
MDLRLLLHVAWLIKLSSNMHPVRYGWCVP